LNYFTPPPRYNLLVPASKKFRVLFVCIGNACRSPMAEAITRRHANDIIVPSSAGLSALGRVTDLTVKTLLANGYSTVGLSSKPFRREALNNFDLIVNLAGESHDRDFAGIAKVENWTVEDPYGQDPAIYQRILEELETRVLLLAGRLRTAQRQAHA
jgi:arsenate reductase (thioredoxin)